MSLGALAEIHRHRVVPITAVVRRLNSSGRREFRRAQTHERAVFVTLRNGGNLPTALAVDNRSALLHPCGNTSPARAGLYAMVAIHLEHALQMNPFFVDTRALVLL